MNGLGDCLPWMFCTENSPRSAFGTLGIIA
jgi:hypothetical protein